MAFYEFTEEENAVFSGLSLRMNVVGVLMVVIGVGLIVFGVIRYPISLELLVVSALGIILFGMGYFTFQSSKRFRKIVETQGHDITYLMEAITGLNRLYTLVVVLIVAVGALLGITGVLVE